MLLFSRKFYRYNISIIDVFKLAEANLLILIPIITIMGIGMVMLYSAAGGSMNPWASKQIAHILMFIPVTIIIATLNPKFLYRVAWLPYLATLVLLCVVLVAGHHAMGATRWLNIGFFKLQPSEFIKFSLVLVLSRYFHSSTSIHVGSIFKMIPPVIIVMIPIGLVVIQPDLATAVICFLIASVVMFVSGIQKKIIIMCGGVAVLAMPFAWLKMHDYQKQRIYTFLNPDLDPLGAGYNIIQSKIAIGSGGLFGKGLIAGGQSQLNFLPEHQTDFIFTMVAEELGLFVCIIITICYAMISFYGFWVANNSAAMFNKILAVASGSYFFIHFSVNACMVTGLIPVAGIPMPMLSYGGSAVATSMICLGFMLNADINKDFNGYGK